MSTGSVFMIREAVESDGQFITDAFDATLIQLAAIGSGSQWGSQPFMERADRDEAVRVMQQALRFMSTGEGEPIRIFIAEVEIPPSQVEELPDSLNMRRDSEGRTFLAVGTVRLSEDMMPGYVRKLFVQDPIRQELEGKKDYVYLEALITDFRAGRWRRGAGAALIRHAQEYCLQKSKPTLYVDSWAGNDKKLVKYYEGQGFSVIDYFTGPGRYGGDWSGAVYRMEVTVKNTS
ncbi:acetyltransferase [Xylaria longipes]|nr:acetyltransferase [Xylaria longipes]